MGTIKATNIEPIADNGTVTLGSSGDTFSLGSGVVQSNLNYPAFEASVGTLTTISSATFTKVPCDTEAFDTDGYYDSATNYRFTPLVAGKYYVYAFTRIDGADANKILDLQAKIYKNGSAYVANRYNFNSTENRFTASIYTTLELNGSTDYVESFIYSNQVTGAPKISTDALFGAYRIGS